LRELGLGIPLFYAFVKYLIAVMLATTFVIGIPCLIDNYYANNKDDWDNSTGFIVKTSIGN
jgi:hypothetical protein